MPRLEETPKSYFWGIFIVGLGIVFSHIGHLPPIVDEPMHWGQIQAFVAGDYAASKDLDMVSGYHHVAAFFVRFLPSQNIYFARMITMLFGVVCVWSFLKIRQVLGDKYAAQHAAQFALLPIFIPYVFLVYTDIPSLAFSLLSVLFFLKRNFFVSALIVIAAMAMRQNNVFWAVFLGFMGLIQFGLPNRSSLLSWVFQSLKTYGFYILPILVFFIYWFLNGSIASSDNGYHPDFYIGTNNIFYLMWLYLVLCPVSSYKAFLQFLRDAQNSKFVFLIPFLAFVVFWLTFNPDHKYNLSSPDYFVRNDLLLQIQSNSLWHILFGMLAGFGAIALWYVDFERPVFKAVIPFGFLFLAFLWLVETRYVLLPFVLILALKKYPESSKYYWMQMGYWTVVSYGLLFLIFNRVIMI